ncbi:hypothetical protein AMJ49_04140 [Parcubacteria bacterium DG_74_2]|nr:MAG: hypothetical protein AMJ49_04140 [Parcubacteria bacterium DG_74_2]
MLVVVWGSIIGLILPCFGLAQATTTENEPLKAPDTLQEAKSFIIELITALPQGMNDAWQKAKEIWQNTWVNWWGRYIKPWLLKTQNWVENLWQKLSKFLGKQVEEQKPIIKEEFEKEKQEIKQDLGEQGEKVKQGIWERLKQLIKDIL